MESCLMDDYSTSHSSLMLCENLLQVIKALQPSRGSRTLITGGYTAAHTPPHMCSSSVTLSAGLCVWVPGLISRPVHQHPLRAFSQSAISHKTMWLFTSWDEVKFRRASKRAKLKKIQNRPSVWVVQNRFSGNEMISTPSELPKPTTHTWSQTAGELGDSHRPAAQLLLCAGHCARSVQRGPSNKYLLSGWLFILLFGVLMVLNTNWTSAQRFPWRFSIRGTIQIDTPKAEQQWWSIYGSVCIQTSSM